MNDNHHNRPESVEEQIERLEIQKIRLETQLIEAGMRRDRVRLVLDIVTSSSGPSSPAPWSSPSSPPTGSAGSSTALPRPVAAAFPP